MHCKICGNRENNIKHEFREMMFGTNDPFQYLECTLCGTIQIQEIPELSKYYTNEYYSFDVPSCEFLEKTTSTFVTRSAAKYFINERNLFGKLVVAWRPFLLEELPKSLRNPVLDLTLQSRILDVGCGTGRLPLTLGHFGFKNLTGADPFINEDIEYANGVTIKKSEIGGITGKFDLIMFHHSLEHIADPVGALEHAHRLLEPGKWCLVRIPIVSSAWEIYGPNWVQLDPPRHLYIFTKSGFISAAEKVGFTVASVVDDSFAFQFWGSEQVSCDIPLIEALRGGDKYLKERFGSRMVRWEQEAIALNNIGMGDQSCFYLQRV